MDKEILKELNLIQDPPSDISNELLFEKSWRFYKNLFSKEEDGDKEMIALMEIFMLKGYHKVFRAGTILFSLVLSRKRTFGIQEHEYFIRLNWLPKKHKISMQYETEEKVPEEEQVPISEHFPDFMLDYKQVIHASVEFEIANIPNKAWELLERLKEVSIT